MPCNIKFIYKTLEDFNENASQKLSFKVSVDNPYKLNDYKPAYGYLFPEIIKGYDFWGHGDLDIVYGYIRAFLDDELLSKYDFISARHDYTAGCFCLYRNSRKMNSFFMRSKDKCPGSCPHETICQIPVRVTNRGGVGRTNFVNFKFLSNEKNENESCQHRRKAKQNRNEEYYGG